MSTRTLDLSLDGETAEITIAINIAKRTPDLAPARGNPVERLHAGINGTTAVLAIDYFETTEPDSFFYGAPLPETPGVLFVLYKSGNAFVATAENLRERGDIFYRKMAEAPLLDRYAVEYKVMEFTENPDLRHTVAADLRRHYDLAWQGTGFGSNSDGPNRDDPLTDWDVMFGRTRS